jgi:hypothetical protein
MRRRNQQRRFPNYISTLGIDLNDLEWADAKISKRERKKLKARADYLGKVILSDWLANAKAQSARTAGLIAADAEDQALRDQQEAIRLDMQDSVAIAQRMVAAIAPALDKAIAQARKERRKMNRAVKREREKLESAGRKLAGLKLREFKARHRRR